MTTLAALWLPILLSAVFVFLASSVIHMALPIHKADYRRLPDEDRILDALRGTVPAGQYRFPWAGSMKECGSPEMQAKFARGPVGTMVVMGGMQLGKSLGQWFAYCLVVGVFVAYLTGLAKAPGSDGVFRFASATAFLAYALCNVDNSIWRGMSWSTTAKFVFDGTVYALVTGATFAWLWPAAA